MEFEYKQTNRKPENHQKTIHSNKKQIRTTDANYLVAIIWYSASNRDIYVYIVPFK